jgi:hypothetical protein
VEFREAYARWAVAAVTHFQKRGYLWELWNEPNHYGFWKPKPNAEEYAAVALAAAKAIHAAAPGEAIIGPATSTIDLAFLEKCFQAGLLEYLAAVSVHPYRQTSPETVEDEYRSLRLLIRKYAPEDKAIPIISGEWGYSTAWKDFDEEKQAKYLPRQFLTNMSNDVALSIWYDWHDDGANPKEEEHRFGIVGHDYHAGRNPVYDPKPAYAAMKTMTEQLGGFRFDKRLSAFRPDSASSLVDALSRNEMVRRLMEGESAGASKGDEGQVLLFTRQNEIRVAAWDSSLNKNEGARLMPASAGKIAATSLAGPRREIEASAQGLPFAFSGVPEVLVSEGPNAMWRVAASWSRIPLDLTARIGGAAEVVERALRNPLEIPIQRPNAFGILSREPAPPLLPGEISHYELSPRVTARAIQRSADRQAVQIGADAPQLLTQPVVTVVSNPVSLMPLPPAPDFLPVRIDNPSGNAFEGWLVWEVDQWTKTRAEVKIAAGETEKVLQLRPPDGAALHHSFQLSLSFTPDAGELLESSLRLQAADDLATHGGAYTVHADGAAAVGSTQNVTPGWPADGLPVGATAALKLSYHFDAGWKFLRVIPPPGPNREMRMTTPSGTTIYPNAFGLWVHADGRGCATRIRFVDQTGQTFQASGPGLTWTGWKFVRFPLAEGGYAGVVHWGGANDGKIHFPIQWDTIFLLDNVSRQPVEGEIYLSAPTLIY